MSKDKAAVDLRRWEVRHHDLARAYWCVLGAYVTRREARVARDEFCRQTPGSKPNTWIVGLRERHDGAIADPRKDVHV